VIIIDTALRRREAEGRPIRVGMIGAGFMARGIANQIVNSVPGMRLVAIANRTVANAERAFAEAGAAPVRVARLAELEDNVTAGRASVTEDPQLLTDAESIDCLIEVTGAIEYGARVTMRAFERRKHVVSMNAELEGTLGPILKQYADRNGVIYTASDGDQPGVQMNLYRHVVGIGLTPLVLGNIKGLQDPYRTPTTQRGFAEKWGQKPEMVTSFADGTKISYEQATVANATGMRVLQRGMSNGLEWPGHVDELTRHYDIEELRRIGGAVDYVVGAKPNPGVYCLAAHDDPKQRHYLNLYKLGEGPLYSFYTPYHLCHFEVPFSVARVVDFGDAVMQPRAGLMVDVVTIAKSDLEAGTVLDGIGGYHTFGTAENADVAGREGLLPMGLSEGARLRRSVRCDEAITRADVELPEGRLADRLRAEQDARFGTGWAGRGD
jgi:predicted homoserine dehydrogenase-like protein